MCVRVLTEGEGVEDYPRHGHATEEAKQTEEGVGRCKGGACPCNCQKQVSGQEQDTPAKPVGRETVV